MDNNEPTMDIDELLLIRFVIATCKEEVEAVIGANTLAVMDDGSPWARAFLKVSESFKGDPKRCETEAENLPCFDSASRTAAWIRDFGENHSADLIKDLKAILSSLDPRYTKVWEVEAVVDDPS